MEINKFFPIPNSQAIYWTEIEDGIEKLKCLDLKTACELMLDIYHAE